MLGQGGQQYGAMIGDDEISGFVGVDIFLFFTGVFGSSLHGFFGV